MDYTVSKFTVSKGEFARLFPAHLETGPDGIITAAGPSLVLHLGRDLTGEAVLDVFEVVRPITVTSAGTLLRHEQTILLRARDRPRLTLQGVVYQRGGVFVFLIAHLPAVDDLVGGGREAGGQSSGEAGGEAAPNYRHTDFAPFDGARDLFLAAQICRSLLTDAHELTEQLKREKAAAVAANAAKSQFLACMSHEIRTPLNGVLGLAALLARSDLDEKQAAMLDSLRECGINLLGLLNDIIDVSRMDADVMTLDEDEFDLDRTAGRLLSAFSAICTEKGLAFRIDVAPDLAGARLVGDRTRLAQILNNLVSNAVKFTPEGSVSVEFSAGPPETPGETVLTIAVRDTGIGIAPDRVEAIFEPFVQADAGITRRFGGTGLGLNICRRLCEKMGGTISVQSAPGAGSCFEVRLPLRRAAERGLAPTGAASRHAAL